MKEVKLLVEYSSITNNPRYMVSMKISNFKNDKETTDKNKHFLKNIKKLVRIYNRW